MNYPILPCGDSALTLQIGQEISIGVHRAVVAAARTLEQASITGVIECVPSYAAICVHYNPLLINYDTLCQEILALPLSEQAIEDSGISVCKELPVCYGGEYGPDLPFVAEHCGLSQEEVIRRHSQGTYLVYMLGFLPGFAYLGGMDDAIACPRLTTPRTKIPAGSVGIAGGQTGIYPLDSPGGWQLIGRTPVRMFSPQQGTFFLSAGDQVHFVPVSPEEYRKMEQQL